jgi:hypothetical protein
MSDPISKQFSSELWDAGADEAMRRAGIELCDGHHVRALDLQKRADAFRRAARERDRELDEARTR